MRTLNHPLLIVHYFGRSGEAVGLSAISFSATLQKDAAPIPNALAATKKTNPCRSVKSVGEKYFPLIPQMGTDIMRIFVVFVNKVQ